MLERYLRFLLAHRAAVLLVVGLITGVAIWSLSQAVIGSSLQRLFLGESPAYLSYLEQSRHFDSSSEVLVLGITDPEALTPAGIARLRTLCERLSEVEQVSAVGSLLDARRIRRVLGGVPLVTSYADELAATPEQADQLRQELLANEQLAGAVLSPDGRHLLVTIELAPDPDRSAELAPDLVDEVKTLAVDAGYALEDVRTGGLIALVAEMIRQTEISLKTILPFVALTLLASVWLLFHRFWPAALAFAVSLVGVIWTMGLAVALDPQINVLMALAPGLILIVGFADVVHLVSAYLLELEAGYEQEEAIVLSGREVGRACLFTSLTTLLGFLCLSLIPTPVFRILGVIFGLGVATALVLAITLVPIALSFLPNPSRGPGRRTGLAHLGIDRVLTGLQRLGLRHPVLVIAVFGAVLAVSIFGWTRLRFETDFGRRIAADNPVRQDQDWFAERFGGTNVIEVYLAAPQPDRLTDPEWLARLQAFEDRVGDIDRVQRVVSLASLGRALQPAATATPPPSELAATVRFLEQARPAELGRFVDFDEGRLRQAVIVAGDGMRETARVGREIREVAADVFTDGTTVEASGLTYLFGDWLDEILAGQRQGFLLSVVMITLVMLFVFRSWRMGLLSMIPNLYPLVICGGLAGLLTDTIDSDALIIGFVALGIGVDDTIHFLSRLQVESRRSPDLETVLQGTFSFAGRAILMTTVILTVGFAPFAVSDYFTTWLFGTALPLCLIVAFLADVLLLPAMVKVGWIPVASGPKTATPAA